MGELSGFLSSSFTQIWPHCPHCTRENVNRSWNWKTNERREEGGTPAIVESIRAGLVFKLKREVGADEIERREQEFLDRALAYFSDCPNLEILAAQ